MTVEKKDGWLEIELNPTGEEAEKQTEAKVEGEKPEAEKPQEEAADKPVFDGRRAEKRIKQLTRRAKTAEEAVAEQKQRADALEARMEKVLTEFETLKKGGAQNQEQTLIAKFNDAKARLMKAQDEADHAGVVQATQDMGDAQARWHLLQAEKTKAPEKVEVDEPPQREVKREAAPQRQALRERAQEWVDAQEWWDKDRVMRAATTEIARELETEQELDPDSDEYYQELDKRLREEFPNKFKKATKVVKPADDEEVEQAVSGARGGGSGAKQSVRLSPSEREAARKLNMTDREYALEKLKVEATKGPDGKYGYTEVEIVRARR